VAVKTARTTIGDEAANRFLNAIESEDASNRTAFTADGKEHGDELSG
jgi:hypothetical protein